MKKKRGVYALFLTLIMGLSTAIPSYAADTFDSTGVLLEFGRILNLLMLFFISYALWDLYRIVSAFHNGEDNPNFKRWCISFFICFFIALLLLILSFLIK